MTSAAAHNEEVEDFVAAEILVLQIENREFERIDDTTGSIDDTTGKKPYESCC